MSGKTIIITGADGALGRVVAALLLEKGYILRASAVNEKSLATLGSLFPDVINKTLFPMVADLSKEAEVEALVGNDTNIAGLVHLAGGYKPGKSVSDYSFEDYEFLFNLNALPTFLLLKHTVQILKKNNGGSIITIGAKPAIYPAAGNAVYAASKSAVVTLTLSVAEEGREADIRANCIVPATLQTPNNLSWATPEQYKTFTPTSDVADVILYLLSDAAKGITGTVIPMYNKINT